MISLDSVLASTPALSSSVSSTATNIATDIAAGSQRSVPTKLQVATDQVNSGQAQVGNSVTSQPSLSDVQRAVKQANLSLGGANKSISFGYEEKLGQFIVQVSDSKSGRVIQQFPSKEFIRFQLHMREAMGLLLDKKA